MNRWADADRDIDRLLMVRYEDMRAEPGRVLAQILEFTGTDVTPEQVQEAVDFAAYENMKKMEQDDKSFHRVMKANAPVMLS